MSTNHWPHFGDFSNQNSFIMIPAATSSRKAHAFTIESLINDRSSPSPSHPQEDEEDDVEIKVNDEEGDYRLSPAGGASSRASTPRERTSPKDFTLPPVHSPPAGFQPVLPGAAAAAAAMAAAAMLHAKPPGGLFPTDHPCMDRGPQPNGHLPAHFIGFQPGLLGGLGPGQPAAMHPFFPGGGPREAMPLYPLLLSRHGGFFGHRFTGRTLGWLIKRSDDTRCDNVLLG